MCRGAPVTKPGADRCLKERRTRQDLAGIWMIARIVAGLVINLVTGGPGRLFLLGLLFCLKSSRADVEELYPGGMIPRHKRVLMFETVEQLRAELLQERERSAYYKHMATTDVLTSLYNRRHGMDELMSLDKDRRSAVRDGDDRRTSSDSYALLMVDIDHFKRVNDTAGHSVGDQVLVKLAYTMRETCRASDVLVRWGGEEFLVICPDTSPEAAQALAQRLCCAVDEACIGPEFGLDWSVTASLGVSQLASSDECFETVIQRADDALYRAKDGGRNRVVQTFGKVA